MSKKSKNKHMARITASKMPFTFRRLRVSQSQPFSLGRYNISFARIAFAIASIVGLCSLLAANWPEWRGPSRDGISKETGLLQEWPAEGPKLLWQKDGLGDGYSTPSIVGDRIFLISNKGLEDEFVQCLGVKD